MIAIDQEKLAGIVLQKGSHKSPEDGICLLEAVAFVRGLPFSDHPSCVSPVLADFGRQLNDLLPDDTRQQLVPLIATVPSPAVIAADARCCLESAVR